MGNCLKIQLKEAVSNEHLIPMDSMVITTDSVSAGSSAKTISFIVNNNVNVKIVGDGYVADTEAGLANQNKTYTLTNTGSDITLYFSDGDYEIQLDNKYRLTSIDCRTAFFQINISDLVYNTALSGTRNRMLNNCIYGNINKPVSWSVYGLYLDSNSNLTGDIKNLGTLYSILELTISQTKMYGKIEDFVSVISERVTSKNSMNFQVWNTDITLGKTKQSIASLGWENATKIFAGNTGIISSSTELFVVGYTDEEIATKTAAGGAWEGKTVTKCD